jgi:hypothetical protein
MNDIEKPLVRGVDFEIIEHEDCGFTIVHLTHNSKRQFQQFISDVVSQLSASKTLPSISTTESNLSS